jgi:hypothetical protein
MIGAGNPQYVRKPAPIMKYPREGGPPLGASTTPSIELNSPAYTLRMW